MTTRADTETIVVVEKPAVLTLDLRSSKNVGDLLSALEASSRDSLDDMKTLLYVVTGDDGVQVPLNGPSYDPERPLPFAVDSVLHISARPMQLEYDIYIRLPHHKFKKPWPVWGGISVKWSDTGKRLRERITAKYGIPTYSFTLSFCGASVFDTVSLYKQKILRDYIVTVRLVVSIKYQFKEEDCSTLVWSNDTMAKLLGKVAKQIDESLECLRFEIIQCSGIITEEANIWLPDRSDIFSAECVTGTIEENGFRTGDMIKVYRQQESSNKRKRESEETE